MRNGLSYSEAGKIGYEKSKIKIQQMKQDRVERYLKNPKRCKFCATIITYEKRILNFCNHSCSASFNNKGIRRWGKEAPLCLLCGKKVLNPQNKYCNQQCMSQYIWNKNKQAIKDGKYKSSFSGDKNLKRFLIEERGFACEECKGSSWRNQPIPLNAHHIDGDAKNNLPSNLKLLCLNCHGITNNFGRKNLRSTRNYRYAK